MYIYPAIDLREGKVVRLSQGDFDKTVVYSENPGDIADSFIAAGASKLHVVDLDGAKLGKETGFDVIKLLAQKGLATQVGGGIRTEETVEKYLSAGASRVILGTVATESLAFVEEMVSKYGDKIAVGVDAKDGKVAVKGWTEVTALSSVDFCIKLDKIGVKTIIYTDISKDGMMQGINFEIYKTLKNSLSCDIIASGGVSNLQDIKNLKSLGIHGAIIGKALYIGAIDLKEAINC